jgi:Protein of unknown function (DUF1573)
MRLHPLTLLPLLLLATPVVAQEPIPWANKFFCTKGESPPPIILHDFGTLPKGTVKTYRFKLNNIYAVPMNVVEPKANCGCVSVIEYTGMMKPSEVGHIDIKLDTSRVDGEKDIQLSVRFEGRNPETKDLFWSYARLDVRVVSRADIAINPGAVQFNTVPAGEKAVQKVTVVYSGRNKNWNITEVGFKKELFDVKVAPVQVRGATAAYTVTATIKANAPTGSFDDSIVLKTNDVGTPALNLSATGMIQAPLRLVRDGLKFGPVEIGSKKEQVAVVQADKEFKITAVNGQGDGVTAPVLPLKANKVQSVTITFAPDKAGPVKKELTIKIDSGETIKLMVEGVGTDPK